MAYESAVIRSVTGNAVQVAHPAIPSQPVTYLSDSVAATDTALSVLDNAGFAQNDLMVIGGLGLDKTEIKKVDAAVTAGTALTSAALTFDHAVDAPVAKTLWDQVEVSGAATVGGTKTVIATVDVQADRPETSYVVTGTTYAYYFARYKNSVTSAFSAYSDAADATGYAASSVRKAKDSALALVNESIGGTITEKFLNDELTNCEREIWGRKKRWSWAHSFDAVIGTTSVGQVSVALSSDIADPNSNKSILSVRIGTGRNLSYLQKAEWDKGFVNVRHSKLASAIAIGATSIVLDSSEDFAETGSVTIGEDSYDYTANDQATNTLTIAASATEHAVDEDVWQGISFGIPAGFTCFGGELKFDVPLSSSTDVVPCNVYLSYYRLPTAIDSDSDALNVPDTVIYHHYLAWKVLLRRSNGIASPESEAQRSLFEQRYRYLARNDRTGQYSFLTPRLNAFSYPASNPLYAKVTNS